MPDPTLPDSRPYTNADTLHRNAPLRGLAGGLLGGSAVAALLYGAEKIAHIPTFTREDHIGRLIVGYATAIGASWAYTATAQHNRIASFLHRYTELEKAGNLTPEALPVLHPSEREKSNYPIEMLSAAAYQAAIWTGVGLLLNHGIYKRAPKLSNILLDYTLWGSLEGAASGAANAAGQDKKAAIAQYFEEKAGYTQRIQAERNAASIDGFGPKH